MDDELDSPFNGCFSCLVRLVLLLRRDIWVKVSVDRVFSVEVSFDTGGHRLQSRRPFAL